MKHQNNNCSSLIVGNVYKLTYYSNKSELCTEIISRYFKYMYKRRDGYYFLSTDETIDLVVKPHQLYSFMCNKVEDLM